MLEVGPEISIFCKLTEYFLKYLKYNFNRFSNNVIFLDPRADLHRYLKLLIQGRITWILWSSLSSEEHGSWLLLVCLENKLDPANELLSLLTNAETPR